MRSYQSCLTFKFQSNGFHVRIFIQTSDSPTLSSCHLNLQGYFSDWNIYIGYLLHMNCCSCQFVRDSVNKDYVAFYVFQCLHVYFQGSIKQAGRSPDVK